MHYPGFQYVILILITSCGLFSCDGNSENVPAANINLTGSRFLQRYAIDMIATELDDQNTDSFEFLWDFGDNTTGTGVAVSHLYENSGTYQLTLTISGESSFTSDTIDIAIKPSLEFMESFALDVDEPSGLSFGLNQETLWTVSDKTGKIYQINLQGDLVRTLEYTGTDLEGVTFDSRDSTLWIVSESQATLTHVDTNGVELGLQWIAGVSDGSGLEGIALDPLNSRIFLLKEKDHSALLLLDDSLHTESYQRIGFAPDYSGLYYTHDQLWMLSHEASSIYLTDTSGTMLESYGFIMVQPEGLVLDEIDSIFYIVDDAKDMLYKYQFWD